MLRDGGHGFGFRSRALRALSETADGTEGLTLSWLLPRASLGWRQSAERQWDEIAHHAAANRQMAVDEWKASVVDWLRHRVDGAEIRLRMRLRPFNGFVTEGWYRTQFEGSYLSGGAAHRGARMQLEHTLLGVPPSAAPLYRPVYAYLEGSDEAASLPQYGEVILTLKKAVRQRSTISMCDSLDTANSPLFPDPIFYPSPLTALSPYCVPALIGAPSPTGQAQALPLDILQCSTVADTSLQRYAEVQIFGRISLDDVSEVRYTMGTAPSFASQAVLNERGITWR